MDTKDYYIGLDIGSDSIGWAVTDENYNFIRKRGKDYWGVYIPNEAQTAVERRNFRSARRRLVRKKQRLDWLQGLFAKEIEKIDETFFIRLKNSKLIGDDKDEKLNTKNILFNDKDFDDKEYFKKYPTIYHLRSALINGEVGDVRMLYLALHHIIKNRGHFIFEGSEFTVGDSKIIENAFLSINNYLYEKYGDKINFEDNGIKEFSEKVGDIVGDTKKYKSVKTAELKKLFYVKSSIDKVFQGIIAGIIGSKITVKSLLSLDEDVKDCKAFALSDSDLDVKLGLLNGVVSAEDLAFVEDIKRIHDFYLLNSIMDGEKYLSNAKVKMYDDFKKDLENLKGIVREIDDDVLYRKIFDFPKEFTDKLKKNANSAKTKKDSEEKKEKSDKKNPCNFAQYIGSSKGFSDKKCSKEDFYKYIKANIIIDDENLKSVLISEGVNVNKELSLGLFAENIIKIQSSKNILDFMNTEFYSKVLYVAKKLAEDKFLITLRSSLNCSIPYQLHLMELEEILKIASKSHSFLGNAEDDTTVKDKIISIMKYRIPYYVGPLNSHSKNAWLVKQEGFDGVKITPWNFDSIIDKDKSENEFIERMTNSCSYLPTCDVLPKDSLLYSEYVFLNELNNFKIRGEKNEKANKLIFEYAKTNNKITFKKVHELLIQNGIVDKSEDFKLIYSGVDCEKNEFNSSMKSYNDLKRIFKDENDSIVDTNQEMFDEIIKMIVVISDKKRLHDRIVKEYGDIISEKSISRIVNECKYSGWGRLSRELLLNIKNEGEIVNNNTGEVLNIIDAMHYTGENFSTLTSSNSYTFKKKIAEYNSNKKERSDIFSHEVLDNLYCSPPVKHVIWKTIRIVREIIKVMGYLPKNVFVEMARGGEDDKKRTVSRKKQLDALYKEIKNIEPNIKEEFEKTPDSKFDSIKVLLYFKQLGRCMYSNERIDISSVMNTKICDREHIYPQSVIKDDSQDNMMLVLKDINHLKNNIYPISADIQNKMKGFWNELLNKGLISKEKFYRLTRTTALSDDEKNAFIARQLVETRQSTKEAANLIKQLLKFEFEKFQKKDPKIVENVDPDKLDGVVKYVKARLVSYFKEDLRTDTQGELGKESKYELVKVRELNNLHHAKDAYLNIVVGNVYYKVFNPFKNKNANENSSKDTIHKLFQKDIKNAWNVNEIKERVVKNARKNSAVVVRETYQDNGAFYDQNITKGGKIPIKINELNGKLADTSKYGGYTGVNPSCIFLVESENLNECQEPIRCKKVIFISVLKMKTINNDEEKMFHYLENELCLIKPKIIKKVKIKTLIEYDGKNYYLTGANNQGYLFWNANELILDFEKEKYSKKVFNLLKNFESSKNAENKDKIINYNINTLKISREKNIDMFLYLCEKFKCKPYENMYAKKLMLLHEKLEEYKNLNIDEQCVIIRELIQILSASAKNGDLSKIGGAKNAGQLGKKEFDLSKLKFITYSPTGYYKDVYKV